MLDIALHDTDDVCTLSLTGTLDETTAHELRPTIDQLVEERRQRVVVDLAGLDLIDSSGVAAVIGLYKQIREHGGSVEVINVRDQPRAIFKLLRFDKLFDL